MALQMVGLMNIYAFTMQQYYVGIIALVFTVIITCILRNQLFITETQFLTGMIEHHEMAVLMATKVKEKKISRFTDDLATNILKSQQREIVDIQNHLTKIA